jgi:dihydrodiol dehydrogenase / D-xylose 1-dehydrogenase (NADP)
MATRIKWGVLGLGSIANTFATALSFVEDAQLVAVGSRSEQKAREFGKKFGVPHCWGSYQKLASDGEVDIVYVATPHNSHLENTIMCLEAGKAVLCEKAFAANAQQAKAMIDYARAKKLFLMEAMWTRFLPLMDKVRQLLSENAIGEVRMLAADFGFRYADKPEKQRILDPNLAGGALLDVGIYPLALSSMLFGAPQQIHSAAYLGQTGVDEQAGIVLSFDKGRLSIIYTAVQTETPHEAVIMGTKGMIRLHRSWWCGNKLTLIRTGKEDQFIELPSHSSGFVYEIKAAQQALRAGKLETDLMPLDETLSIMKTMDAIRAQWGLKYPFE